MQKQYGDIYIGQINGKTDERIFEQYTNQHLGAWNCDFVIPIEDKPLFELIEKWRKQWPLDTDILEEIDSRIMKIGGEQFLWH